MAEKVTYHQESGENREYVILAKHEDGTVDVGPEGGNAVVTKCEVSDEPAFGKVTLAKQSESQPEEMPKSIGELRELAESLGIDHEGMKKADLQDAIAAKQSESQPE